MLPELERAFKDMGVGRVGILGSGVVMESRFHGAVKSVEIVAPRGADFEEAGRRYLALATAGVATDEDRRFFHEAGRKLVKEQGADVVVLSGTDLFLAFDGAKLDYRLADAAEIHIGAIVRAGMQDVP